MNLRVVIELGVHLRGGVEGLKCSLFGGGVWNSYINVDLCPTHNEKVLEIIVLSLLQNPKEWRKESRHVYYIKPKSPYTNFLVNLSLYHLSSI